MIYKNHLKANPLPTSFHSNIVGIDGLKMEKRLYEWLIYSQKRYFEYLTENKTFPKKNDRFVFLKSVINSALLRTIRELSNV